MRKRQRGFTLIELLVVLALLALSVGLALPSWRTQQDQALWQAADQLAHDLERARAQSQRQGQPLGWQASAQGGQWLGRPGSPVAPWPLPDLQVQVQGPLILGPEPILPAQALRLSRASQPSLQVWVWSDGVRPFVASWSAPP